MVVGIPLVAAVAACSVSAANNADETIAGDAGVAPSIPDDATSAQPLANPDDAGGGLCGTGINECWPDDDGVRPLVSGATACAPVVPDGGVHDDADGADASTPSTKTRGCRVAGDNVAPVCDPNSADTNGTDGVACTSAAQCAPGFDCVDGDNGAVCRRYCCSGTCDGYYARNGGPTFCDVRPVNRTNVSGTARPSAPVCMPFKTCTLLEDGDCSQGETCAIVDDKGGTSCVPVDPKSRPGDRCDTAHCATNQTCLGTPGDRTCFVLCRTTSPSDCPTGQTCTTGSAFQDTSYGVCTITH